jgi:preprotein translocase subunit SecY
MSKLIVLALLTQRLSHSLNLREEIRSDGRRKVEPSEEIVTCACAVLKSLLCGLYLRLISVDCSFCEERGSFCNV